MLVLAFVLPTLFVAGGVTPASSQTISFVGNEILGTPTNIRSG